MATHPLAGLRVIELAEDPAGEFEGRLLAEMGADVIKLEPPQGSPTRAVGPFAQQHAGPDTSLNFWYYNSNKRSVILDLRSADGPSQFEALLANADIFLCTLQPAALQALQLDLAALSQRYPRLIVLSVTAFGLSGPWKDYRSSDLVGLAAGGPLHMCGYDDHSIPPIRPGGNQGYHTATSFAHIGVMLALIERQNSGRGQLLDVSMHEALAVNVELANPFWFYPRVLVQRQTCRHAQPAATQSALFQCGDGRYVYYALILSDQRAWQSLVQWMDSKGMAAQLVEPEFSDVRHRQQCFADIQSLLECFFLLHDSRQMYLEGQQAGLPIGVLNAPDDLFDDEHLRARGFFVEVEHEGYGRVPYPGALYRFSSFGEVPRIRAPRLGEHTGQVLAPLRAGSAA